MMAMTQPLKPCPFCGGEAELRRIGNEHHKKQVAEVSCTHRGCTCKIRVGILTGRSTWEQCEAWAIITWNTRHDPYEAYVRAAHWYINASDGQLKEVGQTRAEALRKVHEAEDQLPGPIPEPGEIVEGGE